MKTDSYWLSALWGRLGAAIILIGGTTLQHYGIGVTQQQMDSANSLIGGPDRQYSYRDRGRHFDHFQSARTGQGQGRYGAGRRTARGQPVRLRHHAPADRHVPDCEHRRHRLRPDGLRAQPDRHPTDRRPDQRPGHHRPGHLCRCPASLCGCPGIRLAREAKRRPWRFEFMGFRSS
jgi:hypothetical protein